MMRCCRLLVLLALVAVGARAADEGTITVEKAWARRAAPQSARRRRRADALRLGRRDTSPRSYRVPAERAARDADRPAPAAEAGRPLPHHAHLRAGRRDRIRRGGRSRRRQDPSLIKAAQAASG